MLISHPPSRTRAASARFCADTPILPCAQTSVRKSPERPWGDLDAIFRRFGAILARLWRPSGGALGALFPRPLLVALPQHALTSQFAPRRLKNNPANISFPRTAAKQAFIRHSRLFHPHPHLHTPIRPHTPPFPSAQRPLNSPLYSKITQKQNEATAHTPNPIQRLPNADLLLFRPPFLTKRTQ